VLSVIKLIKTVFADTWAGKWLDAAVDAESPIIMDPFLPVEELSRSDNALYKVQGEGIWRGIEIFGIVSGGDFFYFFN